MGINILDMESLSAALAHIGGKSVIFKIVKTIVIAVLFDFHGLLWLLHLCHASPQHGSYL